MTRNTLELQPFTEGDTWEGEPDIRITETINGVTAPPALGLVSCAMRFKRSGDSPPAVVEISSADANQIQITDPVQWHIKIPKQKIAGLTAGRWDMLFHTINAEGDRQTWLDGFIEIYVSF